MTFIGVITCGLWDPASSSNMKSTHWFHSGSNKKLNLALPSTTRSRSYSEEEEGHEDGAEEEKVEGNEISNNKKIKLNNSVAKVVSVFVSNPITSPPPYISSNFSKVIFTYI